MRKALFGLVAALVAVGVVLSQLLGSDRVTLTIVSGSENESLEPIILEWARENRVDVEVTYLGSVDISRELAKGTEGAYDAVWPAQSLWIALGDTQNVVRHDESILRSPVVLGLKRPIAERLGWIDARVTIDDIREAAAAGAFRLAMTSATQSNSGASAYLGFLHAAAGEPDVLTMDHLEDPDVRAQVSELLGTIDRSSGSSGWLKRAFVANPGRFDAMMNYEALILEANRELTAAGQAPLQVIYPATGLTVSDSPLGYVDRGDEAKEEAFLALRDHLLSDEVQRRLLGEGRRTGSLGLTVQSADRQVWNPAWGVDLDRTIASVPIPTSEVVQEALTAYQTELRKPSLTIWVLDISGSMGQRQDGVLPIDQLKEAMALLLDPEAAAVNLLQPSSRDVTIVLPFNHLPGAPQVLEGSDPGEAARLLAQVRRLQADGGTDVYRAVGEALAILDGYAQDGRLFDHLPAIVAMTDGRSAEDNRAWLDGQMAAYGFARDVPIHAIAFGDADEGQLRALADASVGRLFAAGGDLAGALRSAKGYN